MILGTLFALSSILVGEEPLFLLICIKVIFIIADSSYNG